MPCFRGPVLTTLSAGVSLHLFQAFPLRSRWSRSSGVDLVALYTTSPYFLKQEGDETNFSQYILPLSLMSSCSSSPSENRGDGCVLSTSSPLAAEGQIFPCDALVHPGNTNVANTLLPELLSHYPAQQCSVLWVPLKNAGRQDINVAYSEWTSVVFPADILCMKCHMSSLIPQATLPTLPAVCSVLPPRSSGSPCRGPLGEQHKNGCTSSLSPPPSGRDPLPPQQ